MDAKSRKAMFREKKKEKGEKRIDSPLVRYNELDQAVCRVCNVVIKSEPLWPAHQASRKHKEAVEDIKARAAKSKTVNNSKSTKTDAGNTEIQLSSSVPAQTRPASSLPTSFFDEPDAKRQNRGSTYTGDIKTDNRILATTESQEEASNSTTLAKNLKKMTSETVPSKTTIVSTKEKKHPSDVSEMNEKEIENFPSVHPVHASNLTEESEANQMKGSLPEGFFDNKDADLRARGLEPVKYDIK
ncbi:protein ABA AND ROS SENSITIVE 1-like isoform X1 [Cryptomeria japonica]|uniref:protein ABA AND ROS SENSITIVE 1-like isoform X1 n=1 Tax=Cryptomeria japonica TaxID=3369 RepID=UPI0027DA32BC|nr:protein ABA AND ROS SENSITIVE 1-like isoform X1 [Cryptomeria japonica]